MSKRKTISKSLRFEVLKRDRFSCQYCGARAPDVLLEVDHLRPVARGGTDDILNLVTACGPCNLGKGSRELNDQGVLARQLDAIASVAARREQMQMMLEWREDLERSKRDCEEEVVRLVTNRAGGALGVDDCPHVRRWLREYSLAECLTAIDDAFDLYMVMRGGLPEVGSARTALAKIPIFLSMNRRVGEKPYLPRLLYAQGILRNRLDAPDTNFFNHLEEFVLRSRVCPEELVTLAKHAFTWESFCRAVEAAPRRRNVPC